MKADDMISGSSELNDENMSHVSYASAKESYNLVKELEGLKSGPEGILNAAAICCDRHADTKDKVALRYRNATGDISELTFAAFKERSKRLSRLLSSLGVAKGDRVAGLLPRTPELLITVLAVWRLGAVYQPLFTAFGPKAIEYRLREAGTKVLVTDSTNRNKIGADLDVVVVNTSPHTGDHDFNEEVISPPGMVEPVPCEFDDPALIMFTSGTTGAPKPLYVPIRAIAAFQRYMIDGIGLTDVDRFWNLADPGWAYGLYYAVVGPMALGFATTFYDGPFTVESTYETIQAFGITNLAGSPTAFRALMGAGEEPAAVVRGKIRAVSSAGEPLNPEIIRWCAKYIDAPILDHYGQTELGMVLCNHHGLPHPVRIGSAGYASPGHMLAILSDDMEILGPGQPGILAIDRTRSPSMWFDGYLGRETPAFVGDWYLTGDTCELNDDGSISFVGRSDDIITTSGYRVGPFDVESALMEHEAVMEPAVIGKPDPERTEIIKAFIVLNDGFEPSADLKEALRVHVKSRLSAHAYPREIEFVSSLPKTPSGKVQRFLLRKEEVTSPQR